MADPSSYSSNLHSDFYDERTKYNDSNIFQTALYVRGGISTKKKWNGNWISLKKRRKRFILSNCALYIMVHRCMVAFSPERFIIVSTSTIYIMWLIAAFNEDMSDFMMKHFLIPASLNELYQRPHSVLAGSFSHMDISHILGNMGALHGFARSVITRVGARVFSHLYLISIFTSALAHWLWSKYAPETLRPIPTPSLGASGAISGVIAFACLDPQHCSISISDVTVNPLLFLVSFILADAGGLFRIELLVLIAKKMQEGEVDEAIITFFSHVLRRNLKQDADDDNVEDDDEDNVEIDQTIGYSAHIGGSLGGILFHYLRNNLYEASRELKYFWRHQKIGTKLKQISMFFCIIYTIVSIGISEII
ncbi:hypothetical protein CTEN210_01989 [Chaetoceros tenuissimus]|uniref:Peptidase S54 rhomboid domain-containing protein n=1 Tax=Chaetoceros tenuissimus TaxID=426638 RepID=A0AAD3H067_9STRA|nr:hypothetical protein CTEN210_01989 [Chaetoceros tenuissimus]